MKIIFIRHGDPDYSIDSLTKKGWREAELLSERVRKWDVKDFYVSPLGRAKDTAKVSLDKIGATAIQKDWLKEFYVTIQDPYTGEKRIPWDFMPGYWTKREKLYDKEQWVEDEVMSTGEVKREYNKVIHGFDELLKSYGYQREARYYKVLDGGNEDTIVFFCHLGVQFAILSHLLGISAPVLWQGFFVAPTSVTVLCTEERVKGEAYFRCKKLGDTSHLYMASEKPSDSGFFMENFQSDN